MADTVGQKNPLRYRGYYYDDETGFYYLTSRYYDPEVGRFINADGQVSGIGGAIMGYNLFVYCLNNPINMSDPSGNWPKWLEKCVSKVKNTLTIMYKIATSPLKVITAKVGAGVGIGATVKVKTKNIPVEVGAVTSITDSVVYEKGSIDVRNTTSTNFNLNIAEAFDYSYSKGNAHSYFDSKCTCNFISSSFGQKSECVANQGFKHMDKTLGISLGAYFLLGFEASLSVDLEAWNNELITIFNESLMYSGFGG